MLYHKVTLYIGDTLENGNPGLWDWERLEIAPLAVCVESIEVKPEDTPFDPSVMIDLEQDEIGGYLG